MALRLPRRRTALLTGLSLVVTLVLLGAVLGLAEIALRVAGHRDRRTNAAPTAPAAQNRFLVCDHDSALGWVFAPGSHGDFVSGTYLTAVEANAWGLRN